MDEKSHAQYLSAERSRRDVDDALPILLLRRGGARGGHWGVGSPLSDRRYGASAHAAESPSAARDDRSLDREQPRLSCASRSRRGIVSSPRFSGLFLRPAFGRGHGVKRTGRTVGDARPAKVTTQPSTQRETEACGHRTLTLQGFNRKSWDPRPTRRATVPLWLAWAWWTGWPWSSRSWSFWALLSSRYTGAEAPGRRRTTEQICRR